MAGKDFDAFKRTIEREFMCHPVVKKNDYTAWFAHGEVPMDHLRQFTVQFSVFSNQFLLVAELEIQLSIRPSSAISRTPQPVPPGTRR